MALTPIKIRGKKTDRKRTRQNKIGASSSPHPVKHTNGVPFHGSGRPIVQYSSKKKSVSKLSSIEKLPVELLELIFLENLNINLPRASVALGRSLSSFHLKSQLVLWAFASDGHHGLQYYDKLLSIFHTDEAIAEFQTNILASTWMTLDLIMENIPKLLEKTLSLMFKCSEFSLNSVCSENIKTKLIAKLLNDGCRPLREGNGKEDLKDLSCHMSQWQKWGSASVRFGIELSDGMITMVLGSSLQTKPEKEDKCILHRWRLLICLDGCQLPKKLLHGPWTDEKSTFLEIMMRSHAMVDWIGNTSGEVAVQGLHTALRERNCRAVRNLSYTSYTNVDRWWPKSLHFNITFRTWEQGFHYPNIGVIPQTAHLRTAIIDLDCPVDVVECLLKASFVLIDFSDPAIVAWAVQKKVDGDLRGDWVLRLMRGRHENVVAFEKYQRLDDIEKEGDIEGEEDTEGAGDTKGEGDTEGKDTEGENMKEKIDLHE